MLAVTRWFERRHEAMQMMERIYAELARLDTEITTSKDLIEGVHKLRYDVRGAFRATYKRQPREWELLDADKG